MKSVVDIADAVRGGRLTAVSVVADCLARIGERNPRLNAFVALGAEQALEAATRIDAVVSAGGEPGPLAGVPFGVKDLHRCQGLPTTYGSMLYKDAAPAASSDVFVERLRAAGAIPVGMTAASEFGMDSATNTRLWGTTRNPWNLARTPGGSSGGSAAAVAGGLVPFATAGDSAGSTRSPAAFTGLVGMLASHGRVPNSDGFDDYSGNGVVTRTVGDTARLLDVMQGPHACDRSTLPRYAGRFEDDAGHLDPRGLRACWSDDLGYAVADPEVIAIARAAAMRLIGAAGLAPVELAVKLPSVGRDWLKVAMRRVRVGLSAMDILPQRAEILSPHVLELLERFRDVSEADAYLARKAVLAIEPAVAKLYDDIDVLLCPATASAAFAADAIMPSIIAGRDASQTGAEAYSLPANACWLPSISVPAGLTREGLPVGLMITGARFRDDVVLRLARILESVQPWPLAAPGWE